MDQDILSKNYYEKNFLLLINLYDIRYIIVTNDDTKNEETAEVRKYYRHQTYSDYDQYEYFDLIYHNSIGEKVYIYNGDDLG